MQSVGYRASDQDTQSNVSLPNTEKKRSSQRYFKDIC